MISCGSDVGAIESHQVDRITNLPDCLMSVVLSRLPTKEVAQTCVLSKDWKYKWPSFCDIDIDSIFGSLRGDARLIASFHSFLNRILEFNRDFRISCFLLQEKSHQKSTWISKIVKQHVEGLSIEASSRNCKIVLPTLSTLTKLKLPFDRTLKVGVENCFLNLKSLKLSGKDGAIIRILNGQSPRTGQLLLSFPVLIGLILDRFEFLNVKFVEINAPELICFLVCDPYNPCDYVIKISAPKLKRFISSECYLNKFDLYMPSLRSVVLKHQLVSREIGEIVASRASALLNRAPSLKSLTLSPSIVEALLEWKGVHGLPTFDQLKELTLFGTKGLMFDTKRLMELLQATPHLESLILFMYDYNHVPLQEPLPSCIVSQDSQLKHVYFFHYNGGESQIALTKLLVEKATKLEKVFIYPCIGGGGRGGKTAFKFGRKPWKLSPESSNRIQVCW